MEDRSHSRNSGVVFCIVYGGWEIRSVHNRVRVSLRGVKYYVYQLDKRTISLGCTLSLLLKRRVETGPTNLFLGCRNVQISFVRDATEQ